jgi:hypothetical protein
MAESLGAAEEDNDDFYITLIPQKSKTELANLPQKYKTGLR